MSLKTLLLGRMNRLFTRADLPPRDDASHTRRAMRASRCASPPAREPVAQRRAAAASSTSAPIAPLVGRDPRGARALRREPPAPAPRDRRARPLPAHRRSTSSASAATTTRELLQRFMREFKPEQIKHYLAQEIIARLPNASAIDLAQFAGLNAGGERRGDEPTTPTATCWPSCAATSRDAPQPYEVTLVGRWSEPTRPPRRAGAGAPPRAPRHAARRTRARRSRSRTPTATRRVDAAVGRSGTPLRGRQGRGLRHRRQRHVREPPALRDLARQGRVVGHRLRLDQRHSRRAAGIACSAQRRAARRARRATARRSRSRPARASSCPRSRAGRARPVSAASRCDAAR